MGSPPHDSTDKLAAAHPSTVDLPSEPAGTRAELHQLLVAGGYPRPDRWLEAHTDLLGGRTPADAITDPDLAAHAREAALRFLARRGEPAPALVDVIEARVVYPDSWVLDITFLWDDDAAPEHASTSTTTRRLDLRPYLWGPNFEPIRDDPAAFARIHLNGVTVCWDGGLDLGPDLLYAEAWPVDDGLTSDAAMTDPADHHVPGTREELRLLLADAGLGPRQTASWLDHPAALLSGLVPAHAITELATAARARHAARRLAARLGDVVPVGVQ